MEKIYGWPSSGGKLSVLVYENIVFCYFIARPGVGKKKFSFPLSSYSHPPLFVSIHDLFLLFEKKKRKQQGTARLGNHFKIKIQLW